MLALSISLSDPVAIMLFGNVALPTTFKVPCISVLPPTLSVPVPPIVVLPEVAFTVNLLVAIVRFPSLLNDQFSEVSDPSYFSLVTSFSVTVPTFITKSVPPPLSTTVVGTLIVSPTLKFLPALDTVTS